MEKVTRMHHSQSHEARVPIVMVGTDFATKGGVSAVVNVYRQAGLFERWSIEYVASHEDGSRVRKLTVFVRSLVRFLWLMKCGKLGILHVHSASDASFWRKAVFVAITLTVGRPVVFHLHGGGFAEFVDSLGPLRRRVVRWLLERVSCIICLSAGWARILQGICPRAKITVIRNPICTHAEAQIRTCVPAVRRVVFLGRVNAEKGIFDLLRAFWEIAQEIPNVELVIAGSGDVESAMAEAADLGIIRNVSWLGWIEGSEKERLLSEGGVLALPSYVEGLPMVLLEAMAAGMPVVASRVGAIPEVVQHERDVLLIEPGDVIGLANALRRLLTNQDLRRRLAESARNIIQREFAAHKVIAELETIYLTLSARPR